MKTIYLECKMGVAGDMLAAALLGLVDDSEATVSELNSLGIPKVEYKLDDSLKCGIKGKHLSVLIDGVEEQPGDDSSHAHEHDHHHHSHEHDYDHEEEHMHHDHTAMTDHSEHDHDHPHEHRTLYEIEDIIESLNVCKEVKSDIREVYELLAEAESSVHGVAVDQIHFHEVGNMDAIADISAVCYLMHKIDPDRIIVSPVNVGGGTVKCAHGILPVPAPATAYLLREIPSYESDRIKSELTTPTGAALIKYFADDFANQPVMRVGKIGYGMGKKDFPQANALRALLGTSNEETEQVIELSCNVDDMTPEEIGFATERLLKEGALEVYTIAADMKKNRPGSVIYCMCKVEDREKILHKIFLYTTTIGVRENICNRYVLAREISKIDTPYGEVRVKRSSGFNVNRSKLEYDDLAGIATRTGKSIIDLRKEIEDLD